MRKIIIKIIVLFVIWCSAFMLVKEESGVKEEKVKDKKYYVEVMKENGNEKIELETYLLGVVASEMPYTFEMEALKAQCVASRTYVMQRGLKVDDSTNTQVYKSEAQLKEIHDENYDLMIKKIKEALESTKNEVLTYEGKYISSLFYSCSNGKSSDASWYYGNEVPYLKSVDSSVDKKCDAYARSVEIPMTSFLKALDIQKLKIEDIEYYENNSIKRIVIDEKIFSGREVREKLNLRSTTFTIEDKNAYVLIHTLGYGHGVGMSQYGAQKMAEKGSTYLEILKHYYTNVEISMLS